MPFLPGIPYIGEVKLFPHNSIPNGWIFCDGSILKIEGQLTNLFKVISNQFGGDGRTTFAVPNLRARVPIGADEYQFKQGASGGKFSEIIYTDNLPKHNHKVRFVNELSDQPSSTDNYIGTRSSNDFGAIDVAKKSGTQMAYYSVGYTGSGVPYPIMQPSLTMIYCMAVEGTMPTPA